MSAWLLRFGALLCLTTAGLVLPMLYGRSSRAPSRADSAGAVLRDKLAQVAHEREMGLLGTDEAAGAEAEISRALIASAREAEAEHTGE